MAERFGRHFTELPIKKVGAKSMFMDAFETVKRTWKGPGRGKDWFLLPLKMKQLDEDDESLQPFYDFFEDQVKICRYVASFHQIVV
jgi:hypothetical protein